MIHRSTHILSALVIFLITGCSDPQDAHPVSNHPLVQTAFGEVQGLRMDEIDVFRGIRYAANTRATRFQPPQPPTPWADIADASEFGDSCPQAVRAGSTGLFESFRADPEPGMSEDCLFLNVWTPSATHMPEGSNRPVLVWFHGGGFSTGSGSSRAYDGTRLAQRGDVVVVTVNHRLNVFGYMALADFGEQFAASSVAGVLDMVLALEWIQANIAEFGGNPDNVMIFGESGGGAKVSTLLATAKAEGLFHKAVMQSGVLTKFPPADTAKEAASEVVTRLGLDAESIQEILTLPTDAILEASQGTLAGRAPTIDGEVLTRHPFFPDAAPSGRRVPLMLGTNRTENSLWIVPSRPDLLELTWETLPEAISAALPSHNAETVIKGYRDIAPDLSATDLYLEATTDARWLEGHVLKSEIRVASNAAPTYVYLFDWDTPVDGGIWRSPHAVEIAFVFDNVALAPSMVGQGETQQLVADVMSETWLAFARTGDPNNALVPYWPAYDLSTRPVMVLNASPQLVPDARGAQRRLVSGDDDYLKRYER
jgi:para-nitrobenzyl esterase